MVKRIKVTGYLEIEDEDEIPVPLPEPEPEPNPNMVIGGELIFGHQNDLNGNSSGLFDLFIDTAEVITSTKVGWANNWNTWGGTKTSVNRFTDGSYDVLGLNSTLGYNETTKVKKISDQEISWDVTVNVHEIIDDMVGAAYEFKINREAEPNLVVTFFDKGFSIKGFVDFPTEELAVTFSGDIEDIDWERPGGDRIRAFLLRQGVTLGERKFTMTVTLPPSLVVATPPVELLGPVPEATWDAGLIDYFKSPVDLSWLNKEHGIAGSHGRVVRDKGGLLFEDGTKAKFWGTNINSYAIFETPDIDIPRLVRRLSEEGCNLIRLHHHDSYWVNPTIFGDTKLEYNTKTLAAAQIDKIDRWITAAKIEGIYIWLDLEVQRPYNEDDNLMGWDTEIINKAKKNGHHEKVFIIAQGWSYVNLDIQRLQRDFMELYLTHTNPHTSLRYVDDPAIAFIQFYNENDVTNHFGHMFLANKNVPIHSEIFLGAAEEFAVKNNLDVNKTKATWVPGPSKLFANEYEHISNLKMQEKALSIGYRGLMSSTSQWSHQPQYCLPSLSAHDIIDVHSYGRFDDISKDPVTSPSWLSFIAAAQLVDRPLSISEWAIEKIGSSWDRFNAPFQMAAMACFQDWDAPIYFAYGGGSLGSQWGGGTYSSYSDPALISSLTAAALMFRRGDVKVAEKTINVTPSVEDFYSRALSPKTSKLYRTAYEKHRIVTTIPNHAALPWVETLIEVGATTMRDMQYSFVEEGDGGVLSDTGELYRNWADGIYTINTPRTQVITGWIGDKELSLDNLGIVLENNIGAVCLQSYDNMPIAESDDLLISMASRTIMLPDKKYVSEDILGHIAIEAQPDMKVFKIGSFGQEIEYTDYVYEGGIYVIKLTKDLDTFWMRLRN